MIKKVLWNYRRGLRTSPWARQLTLVLDKKVGAQGGMGHRPYLPKKTYSITQTHTIFANITVWTASSKLFSGCD